MTASAPARATGDAAATRDLTFTAAALEGLDEEMARDPTVFVVGEGIGERGGNFNTTFGLYAKYGPKRLRDTPIAERGFVGMCTGAAMTGTRPVVDFMFADFILDAMGELINQTAKIRYMSSGRLAMPIVLRGCIGIGGSAATHHSGDYYSLWGHVPGLRVVVPTTPRDAKGLLKAAIRSDDPVLFLEHKLLLNAKGPVPDPAADETIPFGAAVVCRQGTDATVVGVGVTVPRALEAADVLAGEDVRVEVIDLRSVAPLDADAILASVAKTGRLLIADDDFGPFGVGAEVAAIVADRGFDLLDAPIRRLNTVHTPVPYSPPLEAAIVPDAGRIERAVRDLLAE